MTRTPSIDLAVYHRPQSPINPFADPPRMPSVDTRFLTRTPANPFADPVPSAPSIHGNNNNTTTTEPPSPRATTTAQNSPVPNTNHHSADLERGSAAAAAAPNPEITITTALKALIKRETLVGFLTYLLHALSAIGATLTTLVYFARQDVSTPPREEAEHRQAIPGLVAWWVVVTFAEGQLLALYEAVMVPEDAARVRGTAGERRWRDGSEGGELTTRVSGFRLWCIGVGFVFGVFAMLFLLVELSS